jgi:hypothetical protein
MAVRDFPNVNIIGRRVVPEDVACAVAIEIAERM